MNVKIAGHDRPVRAPGALPSPIGLLPASENAKWVGMLVSFALGLILSTAHIAGAPAPFGLAFLAAMGYGSGGALCLAGCALGYFAAFGVATGTQLAAGCCLIFLTAYFLRSHPFVQTRWYPSAVSAAAYILTRLVLCLLTGGLSLLLVSRMVLFLLLCAASAYGFDDLLRAQEPRTVNAEICRNVSAVFLLACLLMGVNNLLLFDTLSVGRALSVLILLILSGTGGALCGASAGLILGIAMDVAAGAGALFSVVYAAAGLLSGQFCKHRRGFYLLIFAAAYLLTLFCIPLPELRIGAGVELALAMGAYLVIPKKFVVAVGAFLQPLRGGSGESGLRRYVAGRVGGVAHAYQQLHDTACQAASTAENDADVAKVFDRAADRVCYRCKLQQECWTRRALDTLNIMNDVTRRIQARGRLLLEEFLRSGVSPALAMKLLNSAMLLRDGENWGYATVDLMCMNLFTGEADFYKYGAAPTYVKSGGALKKLRCTSFAPGLEQESGKAPDELHMHLKPGSVAVIASDGVVSDGRDEWLRRLLSDSDDRDMKTLAGSVVRAAIREYGRSDDMTALAVKVEVRS